MVLLTVTPPKSDIFADLARYYDSIMEDINYDRWGVVISCLEMLIPREEPLHLDIGCGTGKLVKRLVRHGSRSIGMDLSWAMVRTGIRSGARVPLAQADMIALPVKSASIDFATCLFDSLNFVLEEDGARSAIAEFERILRPNSLLYFDLVTERMVTEHFEGQKWTEDNGQFTTTWEGTFDPHRKIAETFIQVNSAAPVPVAERIYPVDDVKHWCKKAGLTVLDVFDGDTWSRANRATIRADVVAWKGPEPPRKRALGQAVSAVRQALGQFTD